MRENLTPKKIVEELDRYIVSQDEAKKSVAISLRNRYRRKSIGDDELRKEITPKNIILIGNTGVGKTEIARRLAKIAQAPFIKVEATKYTEIGYAGNDVESIIKDLANIAYKQIREEAEQELSKEDIDSEVIDRVQEDGIVFIDEIDKIVERENDSRGEIIAQGLQRDILPIVEGCTVITKFGPIKTDHILFIAAGAFSQSSPSDIMPELQGRFPVKVKLENLEREDFIKILTQVKYNLLEQYVTMLLQDSVELKFQKSGIEEIAELAIRFNDKVENIGARRLHMILETLLRQVMFEAPYETVKKISIDRKYVAKIFKDEYEEENLDKYIL